MLKRLMFILTLTAMIFVSLSGCSEPLVGLVSVDGFKYYYTEDSQLLKGTFILDPEYDQANKMNSIYYLSGEDGKASPVSVVKVNEHITAIVERTTTIIYIIEGDTRALVVDAGTGFGNFDELVTLVTNKPYDIWLTHAHSDHIGGAFSTSRDVYLNPNDQVIVPIATVETRLAYIRKRMLKDTILESDLAPLKDVQFIDLHQGDTVDLGNYTIKAFDLPGHTPGQMVFLCVEDRILISGDGANPGTKLNSAGSLTVEEYLEGLKGLKAFDDEWDYCLISHITMNPYAKTLIDDLISICQEIVDNGFSVGEAYDTEYVDAIKTHAENKEGQLIYYKDRIYKD